MTARTNSHGQPVGPATTFTGSKTPAPVLLTGRGVRLEPIGPEHTSALFTATCGEERDSLWTYRGEERPAGSAELKERIADWSAAEDQVTFAIVPIETGRAAGIATLMRPDPVHGSVEVGGILYGPQLQRSRAATEAMSLLMEYAFTDLGVRRYEWKCDSLNQPSRRAAVRLGFIWEGRFRNAVVYKGRSRDTDWFSITEAEYPRVRKALDDWLDDRNFDAAGRQRVRLLARPSQ